MDASEGDLVTLNAETSSLSPESVLDTHQPEHQRFDMERNIDHRALEKTHSSDKDIKYTNQLSNDSEELLVPRTHETVNNSAETSLIHRSTTEGTQKDKCWTSLRVCSICNLVVSLIAALLTGTFPLIFHTIMNHELSLQPGATGYKMWLDSPVPVYVKFYMFNLSNAQDVLNFNFKPILKETGPYTFREFHTRVKVNHFSNETIKYQQIRTWQYIPELSNGSLDDNITSLNVPLMTAAHALRDSSFLMKVLFNRELRVFKSTRFITKSVNQLLFQGYDDVLLNFSSKLPPGTFPSFDKFGWFYGRNGSDTYDGIFNIFSGAGDISKLGQMDMWNSTRQTKFYDSYCGQVNGSFGEAFPPRQQKTNITLYVTDLCRSLTLDFKEEVDHFGVKANRYHGSSRVFDNGTSNPDNWCFCVGGVCRPSGVMDFSTCRDGAPAFVSFPHFLYADPFYLQQVDGLNPQEELHQFNIDLEPETGIPVSVSARLQVNILMEPISDIGITENITRTYLPMLWFTMSADVTETLASSIKLTINLPFIGTTVVFVIFCSCLFAASICNIILKKRSRRYQITRN